MEFNSGLLIVARESRGMSQSALAKNAEVAQGHLSKIENGIGEPSKEVVNKIAKSLNYPASFFYQPDRVYGLPASVHPMHRKKASVRKKEIEILHAKTNLVLMHVKRFLKSVEFTSDFELPCYEVDEYGTPSQIAELIRRMWLAPNGPIDNLTNYIERTGVLVILLDFPNNSISGISINSIETPPCIFLNRVQKADRMRFTLAHEFGHLVMHKFPHAAMEGEANEFASALLMPAQYIKGSLMGNLDFWRLGQLKLVWKVAMQALLYRANTLNTINKFQYQRMWKEFSKRGNRIEEPREYDFPIETPNVFPEMINLHFSQLEYSVSELAQVLRIYEPEFRRLYNIFNKANINPTLRVVK